jgi:hypothetical protein
VDPSGLQTGVLELGAAELARGGSTGGLFGPWGIIGATAGILGGTLLYEWYNYEIAVATATELEAVATAAYEKALQKALKEAARQLAKECQRQ